MSALPDVLVGGRPPRRPFAAARLPPIAHLVRLAFRADRPRWRKRLFKRPLRLLFDAAYHGLKLGGEGRLEVALADGAQPLGFDARQLHFYAAYRDDDRHGHEPEVAALLETLLAGDRVFYDVGANFGYFSLYAAGIAGYAGAIHAFEPMPATFADLARCVRELGLGPRVACHEFALSDRAGSGLMATADPLHTGIARLVGGDAAAPGAATVALRRLDDLELPPPFLAKIDVEEHEFEALKGGEATLRRERPMLVVENWLARDAPERTLRPLRLLEALGYALFDPCWSFADEHGGYVWPHPDPARPGAGTETRRLALVRFAAEQRPMLREQINVFACHRSRIEELAAGFAAARDARRDRPK